MPDDFSELWSKVVCDYFCAPQEDEEEESSEEGAGGGRRWPGWGGGVSSPL